MRWPQKQRLLFIGQRLLDHGRVNRADLQAAFGISPAQCSTDFRAYEREQPGVMAYDASQKAYVVIKRSPNPAGETIPSSQGNARAPDPATGETPVGSGSHLPKKAVGWGAS